MCFEKNWIRTRETKASWISKQLANADWFKKLDHEVSWVRPQMVSCELTMSTYHLFLFYEASFSYQKVRQNLPKGKTRSNLTDLMAQNALFLLHSAYILHAYFKVQTESQLTTCGELSNSPLLTTWSVWANRKAGMYSKTVVSWVRPFSTQNYGLNARTIA